MSPEQQAVYIFASRAFIYTLVIMAAAALAGLAFDKWGSK